MILIGEMQTKNFREKLKSKHGETGQDKTESHIMILESMYVIEFREINSFTTQQRTAVLTNKLLCLDKKFRSQEEKGKKRTIKT